MAFIPTSLFGDEVIVVMRRSFVLVIINVLIPQ
jgi:hypothetical protein